MHDVNDQHGFKPGEWDSDHPLAAEAQRMLLRALSSRQQAFGSFFLSRLFGFEISYGADTCTVRLMADATKGNPQGSLHGGVIATAMDISMGHLLRHHRGPGTTLEMKVQISVCRPNRPRGRRSAILAAGAVGLFPAVHAFGCGGRHRGARHIHVEIAPPNNNLSGRWSAGTAPPATRMHPGAGGRVTPRRGRASP